MKSNGKIHFFTDQDVPNSVGDYLEGLGCQVTRLRDIIDTKSKDPFVAATCAEGGLVLVSFNHKDFSKIIRDNKAIENDGKVVTKSVLNQLSRLDMDCEHVHGKERLEMYIDIVLREMKVKTRIKPVRVWIGNTHCRIYR